MLTWSIVLLVGAALGGLVLASLIFRNRTPPIPLALGHGAIAVTGVVLALLAAMQPDAPLAINYGVATLVLAALGGAFLFSFQLRGKAHPRVVVVLHALFAIGGVGTLVMVAIFR